MPRDLVDDIAGFLEEHHAGVAAAELAKRFLKIASTPAAESLLRGILGKDIRFREDPPGVWTCRSRAAPTWLPRLILIPEILPGADRAPWAWRVSGLWVGETGEAEPFLVERIASPWPDPKSLAMLRLPMASTSPARIRRWLEALERILALSEHGGEILDLQEAAAWLARTRGIAVEARRLKDPAEWPEGLGIDTRASEGIQGDLDRAAALLAACSEESEGMARFLELSAAGEAKGRAVSFDGFSFSRQDVASLPETPGIYRYLGDGEEVLYVGKAKNLKQRVSQYFQPLQEGSARREAFLATVRDLAWVPLPTELAALTLESERIRTERPPWNVQVEVHGDADPAPPAGENRVFAVPSRIDPGTFEIYLASCSRAARIREPGGPGGGLEEGALAGAFKAFFSNPPSEHGDLLLFHPQEAVLVRRWFQREGDGVLRLNVEHFSTWQAAAAALIQGLSSREAGGARVKEAPAGRPPVRGEDPPRRVGEGSVP